MTINSGSYTGIITEDSYKTGENNAAKNEDFSSVGTLVITNDNTAAVVKDEKGNVSTYSDLNKAVEKSGDQPVTVLKVDDVAALDIKPDTTLNLVAGKDVEGLDEAIEKALAASENNAAFVKGEDGKYHTYSDLSEAVKASGGAAIVVTDKDALTSLKDNVKEGDKLNLNLVDAEGNKLTVDLGDDLELSADGTVSKKQDTTQGGNNQGGNQGGGNVTPVTPVRPSVDVMDTPVADDPTVEIDDPSVPLAGLPFDLAPADVLTRGQLVAILHWLDGAPAAKLADFLDVAADSDFAEAIGWASDNGIANGVGGGKFDPDSGVTRGQLVTILNRYAAYVGSDVTVELDGDADEVLIWAVAEEIINDFFARLEA